MELKFSERVLDVGEATCCRLTFFEFNSKLLYGSPNACRDLRLSPEACCGVRGAAT
jgi:hypothetical protein